MSAKVSFLLIGANTKGGKGVCPVLDMRKAGVTVGVGTDGPSSGNTLDLFTQFKMIASAQKTKYHSRGVMTADEIVELGTMGGARVFGEEESLGSIEPGKQADLVLIETESVNMFPVYNPCSAIVYSANASNVDSVWVAGRQMVEGHRLLYADVSEERRKLEAVMPAFRAHAEKYSDML